MKALVASADPELVRLEETPDPVDATPGHSTVRVRYISVNRGELHRLKQRPAGWLPGWDFAGEVVHSSSPAGPSEGQRVCGVLSGAAWAQYLHVPDTHLADVPDELPLATAACVPVAGLTALRALRLGPSLYGQRVLVVGAAGGVGQFAVPLARAAGADVFGTTASRERAAVIAALGATPIVGELSADHIGSYDLILENAGGKNLERAFQAVAQQGSIVTFGNSEHADSVLPTSLFYERQAHLIGFHLLKDMTIDPPSTDLNDLVVRLTAGMLTVRHTDPVPWTQMSAVLRELESRKIDGKAVLEVTH